MADVEVANGGLEQRQRKPKAKGVEAAQEADAVPDFDSAGEFAAENGGATTEGVTEGEAEDGPSNKIYFVRVPRPPFNDEKLKKLQGVFQEQVAKLKVINAKLGVKRVSIGQRLSAYWGVGVRGARRSMSIPHACERTPRDRPTLLWSVWGAQPAGGRCLWPSNAINLLLGRQPGAGRAGRGPSLAQRAMHWPAVCTPPLGGSSWLPRHRRFSPAPLPRQLGFCL